MALYIYRTSLATRRSHIFSFLVILIWFAFGNRGEIFPLIFFIILSLSKRNNLNFLKIGIFFFLGVVAFFYLGLLRSGINLIDKDVMYVIISNFTGSHILYTMLSIVYHVDTFGLDYGGTILDYIVRAIPSFIYSDRPGDLSRFLVDNYESGGGTHFFGEMYYNFGILGVYIQALTFGSVITYVQNKSKRNNFLFYIAIILIFLSVRTTYYGFIMLFKTLIFIVPILFFIYLIQFSKHK